MDAIKRIIIEFDNIEITGRDIDVDDISFEPGDPEEYSDPDLTLTFDTDLGIWKDGNGSKVSNAHMEIVEKRHKFFHRMNEAVEGVKNGGRI